MNNEIPQQIVRKYAMLAFSMFLIAFGLSLLSLVYFYGGTFRCGFKNIYVVGKGCGQ
jgi:hypothetical protein